MTLVIKTEGKLKWNKMKVHSEMLIIKIVDYLSSVMKVFCIKCYSQMVHMIYKKIKAYLKCMTLCTLLVSKAKTVHDKNTG